MASVSATTRLLRSMPPSSTREFITARYAHSTGCSPRIRQIFRAPARDGTQTTKGRNCWRCGPTSYGAAGTLWVITRLKGPRPWTYFYLYVIMDVYSRYVVGFMIAYQESQALAKEFIEHTLTKHGILPGQLTLHADRVSAMTSNSVALLLSDLGVAKTHSRPHVSNDNPYSEAQFKTLKYRPEFPERFGTVSGAREVCAALFARRSNCQRKSSARRSQYDSSVFGIVRPMPVALNSKPRGCRRCRLSQRCQATLAGAR